MLTDAQKLRLKELILRGKERSDVENTEFSALTEQAKSAGYEYDEATGDAKETDVDEDPLSEDAVKTLICDGVGTALSDIGLDEVTVKAIKASIEGAGKIDAEAIKTAVKDAVGGAGFDMEALEKAIKAQLPKDALTTESVKSILDDFKKDIMEENRRASKMQHDATDPRAPIEHRSGNLTVGQKQLLNLCLMQAPQTALDASDGAHGIKRPESVNDGISAEQLTKSQSNGVRHTENVRREALYGSKGAKALTTGGAGTGLELIDVDLSSDLQVRLFLASELATLLVASEVQMPTNPFKFPLSTTRTTFSRGVETVAPAKSTPGTADITLDAQKLIGITEYSYEADEDAIIAILPFLQENMGNGAAQALEDAFINGDNAVTHQDSDTEAAGANVSGRLFEGFRKHALTGSLTLSFASGGISAANIGALRKTMAKYGIRPSDMFLLCGTAGYNDIIQLPETLTADKAGPNAARILTGVAPSLFGFPIIVSDEVREDLNAAGVFDGVTETKGSLFLVHRPSWLVGVRKGFTVETDVDKEAQVNKVIASFRRDFQPMETPAAGLEMVAMGFNYDAN